MEKRLEKLDELKALEKKKADIEIMIEKLRNTESKASITIKVDKHIEYNEEEISVKFRPQNLAIVKYLNLELDQVIQHIRQTVLDLYN